MARRRSVWSAFVAASVLLVLVGTGLGARLPALPATVPRARRERRRRPQLPVGSIVRSA